MYSLNKVIFIGNLVREPEVRFTNEGIPVTSFSIAINEYRKDRENQETTFIKIVTWRRLAENCGQYLHKGSTVLVEGRLKSRKFTTKEGIKVSTVEVIAQNVQFLRLKDREEAPAQIEAEPTAEPQQDASSEIDEVAETLPEELDESLSSSDDAVPF
jgi:single-strand DNA-binding protein